MKKITAESNIDEVLREIGVGSHQKLHQSSKRENTLRKYAKLKSRDPGVTLVLRDIPTAFVASDGKDDKVGEFRNIVVSNRDFEQKGTDFPTDYHQYLIQKSYTAHEVGHILYTSAPETNHYIEKVKEEDGNTLSKMFEEVSNILEDGAIEKFLAEDFNVGEELTHMRRTIHEDQHVGLYSERYEEGRYDYPFYFAIKAALFNIGIYDNGDLEKLLDPSNDKHQMALRGGGKDRENLIHILPIIRDYIKDIQNEYDSKKRCKLQYELWKEYLKPHIQRSTTPGKNQFKQQGINREGDTYLPGVPDNIGEQHGGQTKDKPLGGGSGGDKTLGEERKEEIQEGQGENAEKKAEKEINQESRSEGGDWEDELEEIINSLGAGDGVDEVFIPDDGSVNQQRKNESVLRGRKVAKFLRSFLKRKQRDKIVRKKPRGDNIDSRNLIEGERGSPKIHQKIIRGTKKDYSCIFVVDRSGSMGSLVEEVEVIVGSMAYGLEEVGVDTSIMETYQSKTAICKPFQTKTDEFEKKIFADRCGGGTPLRYSIRFAKERMKRGHGQIPFMVIITDGRPSKSKKVKEEIRTANFPVLGIYLGNKDVEEQMGLYDHAIKIDEEDDLSGKLLHLIRQIMF